MGTAKKILVVDDEQDVRTYLTALLTDAGYEVETAVNGMVALEQVRAAKPALVSLDITMPEKSGIGFYREMRKDPDLAAVPIVIVTGVVNPWASPSGSGNVNDFLSSRRNIAPPDGYFEKPVDSEAYLAKVAELVE